MKTMCALLSSPNETDQVSSNDSEFLTFIASPTQWYAALSTIDPFVDTAPRVVQLIESLTHHTAHSVARARLAQIYLFLGLKATALDTVGDRPNDPLEHAIWLLILAASYRYNRALDHTSRSVDLQVFQKSHAGEAEILTLYAIGLSRWGQWEFGLAIPALNLAVDHARHHLPELLWLVVPLLHNAKALATDSDVDSEQERLYAIIRDAANSSVKVVEAREKLAKLLDVRGNYVEAARVAKEVPGDRFEKGFRYIENAAAGNFNLIDWDSLRSRDAIYVPIVQVIRGMSMFNPEMILSQPPPPSQGPIYEQLPDDASPYHPRSLMTWNTAFAWACLMKEDFASAKYYLNNARISPGDYDMMYAKNVLVLQLFAMSPQDGVEFGNIAQIVHETQRLVASKLYQGTLLMRMTPQAIPYAGAILLAAPGGCPMLEPMARPFKAILNGRGLELAEILYTAGTSVVKYLAHPEQKPEGAKPSTIRMMRARWKNIAKEIFKSDAVPPAYKHPVRAQVVLERLGMLAEFQRREPSYTAWLEAIDEYARANKLNA